jgi:hypothetical protein
MGAVLNTLEAWRADSGFRPQEARTLRVVASAHKRPDEEIPEDERGASFDWILLEIENKEEAYAAPTVPFWSRPDPSGPFLVCGYPGAEPHTRGKVKPTIPDYRLKLHESDLGVLRLVGDETRPGMSGGGLFDTEGVFVGIHRSKRDEEMKLVAVSADFIRQRLKEIGFDVVTGEISTETTPIAELVEILRSKELRMVDWHEVLNFVKPRSSNHPKPRNLSDDDALVSELRELEKLGPDERGIRPLHRFALKINRLKPVDALKKWIDKNVPADSRIKFEEPEEAAPKGEPRIVVEMTLQDPPTPDPEKQSIEYKIWFVGFKRSPPSRQEVEPLNRFKSILESAWDEVRGADLKRVWVELFLPKQLLAWNVESLDFRLGKFPVRIGATQPFSIRLNREHPLRLETEEFDRSLCLHRYGSFDLIPKPCGSHVVVEVPGDVDPADLFTDLQGKENVLGVLWTSHPRTAENDAPDVWDAVCQAGVPLVVWLREVPEECPDVGASFHDKTWDELAAVVKELRNVGAQERRKKLWHLGQHLAVILDDDRRVHPNMFRLQSPH